METKGSLKETEKDQTSLRYLKRFKNSSEVVQRDHGKGAIGDLYSQGSFHGEWGKSKLLGFEDGSGQWL